MHIISTSPTVPAGSAKTTEEAASWSKPITCPSSKLSIVPPGSGHAAAVRSPARLDGEPTQAAPITRRPTDKVREEAVDAAGARAAPSPLTAARLEAMPDYNRVVYPPGSRYNADGRFATIVVGTMTMPVHPEIASIESRIQFVNEVAAWLHARPADERVTVVSIGSGQLLMEQLIHLQLSPARQSNTAWRCIDLKNGSSQSKAARINFMTDKADARMFTTVDGYLMKEVDKRPLAALDRTAGPVLILVIDPPTAAGLPGQPTELQRRGVELAGLPVAANDVRKANSVLVAFAPKTAAGRARLDRLEADLSSQRLTMTDVALCSLNEDGTPHFEMGEDAERFAPDGAIAAGMREVEGDMLPIERLHASASRFASRYNGLPFMNRVVTCIPFSDYAVSVKQAMAHFAGAQGPVAVARLENSQVSVTPLPAV